MERLFTGRQDELKKIWELFDGNREKNLWFCGTPHIGKTSLLQKAYTQLLEKQQANKIILFIKKEDTTDYVELRTVFERALPDQINVLLEIFRRDHRPNANEIINCFSGKNFFFLLDDFSDFNETVIPQEIWLEILKHENVSGVVTSQKEPKGEASNQFEKLWLELLKKEEAGQLLKNLIEKDETTLGFPDENQKKKAIELILTWAGYHPFYLNCLYEEYLSVRKIDKRRRTGPKKRYYIEQFKDWAIRQEGKNHFERLRQFWEENKNKQVEDALKFLIEDKQPQDKGGASRLKKWGIITEGQSKNWLFSSLLIKAQAQNWYGKTPPPWSKYFTTNGLIQIAIANAFLIFLCWFILDILNIWVSIPTTYSLLLSIISLIYFIMNFYYNQNWPGRLQ